MNNLWPVIDWQIFFNSAWLSYTGTRGCHIDFVYGDSQAATMTKQLADYSSSLKETPTTNKNPC
jgi:hypothetical protein